jgi:hypothetical protein
MKGTPWLQLPSTVSPVLCSILAKEKKSNRMTNNIFDLHPIIEEHL